MRALHATAPPDALAHSRAALALRDDPVQGVIRRAGARRGWWEESRAWRRTYARSDPHAAPWCTLVYETADDPQRLCVVELHAARPESQGDDGDVLAHPALGWLRVAPFPADSKLETLAEIIDGAPATRVLRYRPGKRCTLRLGGDAHAGAPFGKVFADDRGARIHAHGVALWEARDRLGFAVARPGAWDPRLRLLTQGRVAGVPVLARLHGPDGVGLARRMGEACASLACAPLRPETVFDGAAQLARSERYAEELCARIPAIADDAAALLAALARVHAACAKRPLRPIHGAPHAHQWLDDGGRLGLVDFDRFSLGDPELDAATFVAETDFEDPQAVAVDALNAAFIDRYERVAGPLDRTLLQAYRAHKQLAKALKAARSPDTHASAKAERNLRRALRALAEVS